MHCAIAQAVASRAWLVSAITREARGENVGGLSFWHSRAERDLGEQVADCRNDRISPLALREWHRYGFCGPVKTSPTHGVAPPFVARDPCSPAFAARTGASAVRL